MLSLYIFGGQVLRGFSFALVVGILIGTYSSIAVAAPMLVAWQEWRARQGKAAVLPAGKALQRLEVRQILHGFSQYVFAGPARFWYRGEQRFCGKRFDAGNISVVPGV